MLALRLSSLYALQSWGFDSEIYAKHYNTAIDEYRTALNKLRGLPDNPKEIDNTLFKIERYFKFFENSKTSRLVVASMVRRTADRMVQMMDKVTNLYQEKAESKA
jgi:CHASE3 domain sensor protein